MDVVDRTEKFLADIGVPVAPRLFAEQILVRLQEGMKKLEGHVTAAQILEVVNATNVYYVELRRVLIEDHPDLDLKNKLPVNLVSRIWDEVILVDHPENKLSMVQLRAKVGHVYSGGKLRF